MYLEGKNLNAMNDNYQNKLLHMAKSMTYTDLKARREAKND